MKRFTLTLYTNGYITLHRYTCIFTSIYCTTGTELLNILLTVLRGVYHISPTDTQFVNHSLTHSLTHSPAHSTAHSPAHSPALNYTMDSSAIAEGVLGGDELLLPGLMEESNGVHSLFMRVGMYILDTKNSKQVYYFINYLLFCLYYSIGIRLLTNSLLVNLPIN